ncbi:MAG: hypothetical protein VKM92_00590 [Cyanobacteriota bacterium]|nr:hypothetical protein [Cyanobacteriota bacterium]
MTTSGVPIAQGTVFSRDGRCPIRRSLALELALAGLNETVARLCREPAGTGQNR